MNFKRFGLACIAGFVFVFIFEMLWHGFLMKGMYDATMSVWRPEDQHDMKFIFLSQFLFSATMVLLYSKVGDALPCRRGVLFGLLVGLVLAAPQLGTYCYLPIPLTISLMWVCESILKAIGVGVVIAAIYKKQSNTTV